MSLFEQLKDHFECRDGGLYWIICWASDAGIVFVEH